jgi:hypothetical protein
MATVSRTYMTDDIDGSEDGVETVRFNAEGVEYEIDLSPENAARLRKKLQRFVDAATPVKAKSAPAKRTRRKAATVATSKQETQDIREWAKAAGLAVSARGRISQAVKNAFEAR